MYNNRRFNKVRNFILFGLIVFFVVLYYTSISDHDASTSNLDTSTSDLDTSTSDPARQNTTVKLQSIRNVSGCYAKSTQTSINYFIDIMDHEYQPTIGKSIFFLETSCSNNSIAKLNARQACAIESTAKHNSNRDIFVLYVSPVGFDENESLPQYFDILLNYPNVHLRTLNLWRFSSGTPIDVLLKTNKLFKSKHVYEHMSDILRAITLLKYGGFYLDLDVVVQKSFDSLEENIVGDDWAVTVNGAVMHLNNYGDGADFIHRYLKEVIEGYNPNVFNAAGPTVLTRVLEEMCSTQNRTLWTRERCSGIKLEPKETFYPVAWDYFYLYLDRKKLNEVLELAKNSILIHVWNDLSKKYWFKIGTKNAHQVIAKKNCPNVYGNSTMF